MVRFSCAVMDTGSDGWLTTRLISSLPAEEEEQLHSHTRCRCPSQRLPPEQRTILGLRFQRRAALLCIQVVK